MKRIVAGSLTVSLGVMAVACDGSGNADSTPKTPQTAQQGVAKPSPELSTNVDDLARHVALPVRPVSAVWEYKKLGGAGSDRLPAPSDYALVAVLNYNEADAAALEKRAASVKAGVDAEGMAHEWFPAELMSHARSNRYGDKVLPGTRFSTEGLLETSFTKGHLHRVTGTNSFVLYLSSM